MCRNMATLRRLSKCHSTLTLGILLLLPSALTFACALATAIPPGDVRDCADISGRFSFYGDWLKPVVVTMKGEALPNGRAEEPPRIDEHAFSFVARTITNPQSAVLDQDVMTGNAKIDIFGSGFDARFTNMSAKLPFTSALKCIDGSWVTERMVEGKSGGVRPTETKTRISLRLTESGRLMATGEKQSTSGNFSRSMVSQSWTATFRKLPPER